MKKGFYISILFVSILAAFSVGVHYGTKTGVKNFYHLEKVLSTNIDVLRARDLKGGSEKELKHIYWEYETAINEALDSYNWYQRSGNKWFSKLFLSSHLEHLEKSVEFLALHRNLNPIENDYEFRLCDLSDSETDKQLCLNELKQRYELIERYGEKS